MYTYKPPIVINIVIDSFVMQFYDHFFDWGLKEQITNLTVIRQRNGINMQSIVNIQAADM